MKRQMFFATAFSAALAVGAAAQTGTSTPQQEKSQPSQAQQVTMTGCLERATAGTAGTAGTETSGASGGEFILSNASSGSASGTAGTTGTEPAGKPGAAMGSKYKLQGGDREDLQKYLNSKVEIRGTLDRSAMGTGTATPQTEPSRPGQASTANLQTLRVSSVRQIAKTCEGGN